MLDDFELTQPLAHKMLKNTKKIDVRMLILLKPMVLKML